jgi:hypothetical protein
MIMRDELQKLALAATPGIWQTRLQPGSSPFLSIVAVDKIGAAGIARDVTRRDASFIASVGPQIVLSLLHEIAVLRNGLEDIVKDPERRMDPIVRANVALATADTFVTGVLIDVTSRHT